MEKFLELYKYIDGVNDAPFPDIEEHLVIREFRYDAKRMGGAPTISFTAMHRLCLDNMWSKDVYATFNGERYYIKQTPTSSYSNSDTRYKHEVELVSERTVLDNVYFYDVVTGNNNVDKPVSNSSKFTFFGDIHEYVTRLDYSLKWANVDYTIVVDAGITSEEKQVTFEDQVVTNALQEIYNIYQIPYYFVGKVIHVGEYQDNIDHVFKYGAKNSLLSISKNNANAKIVNRITGVGSQDNIPYYYPNDDEKGVTIPLLNGSTNGVSISNQSRYRKVRLSDKFVFHHSIQTQTPLIDSSIYTLGDLTFDKKEEGKDAQYSVDFYYTFSLDQGEKALFNVSTEDESTVDLRYEIYKTSGNHLGYFSGDNTISLTGGTYNLIVRWTFLNPNVMFGVEEQLESLIHSKLNIAAYIVVDEEQTWTLKNIPVNLYSYGLSVYNPVDGDVITIKQESYINPQPFLMPYVYRTQGGNERFYNAENNTYRDENGEYYVFENEYSKNHPSEHIENFDDIKPTIKNVTNAKGFRIDRFVDFAYDTYDNDEVDEEGKFIHKYFFAKLNKLDGKNGFNLFDHAIDESEMVISMTSGSCGSCSFKVMVNKDTQKNTVQVDEYGNLLRDSNGNVRFGSPQDRQNDTEKYEVWIALEKDIDTFGVLMPNATNKYRPSAGDTFVILHIDLPKAYIEAAEKRLDEKLIKYMYDNNFEKFNFSIAFSRIFFAENPSILNSLNENSKITIEYNGREYSLYASSISIAMTNEQPLPEIKVELNDNIAVSQNQISQIVDATKKDILSKTTKDVFWGDIKGVPSWIGSEKPRYSYSELSGRSAVNDSNGVWVIKKDDNGNEYVYTNLDIVTQKGLSMYHDTSNLDLPSIYDGLPLDNDTIYWEEIKDEEGNVIDKRIKAGGGSGEGGITPTLLGDLTNVGAWANGIATEDRIMVQRKDSASWVALNLSEIGGGSADFSNVLSSGNGNAFTSFTLSEDKTTLTFVKGLTFAEKSDSLSGYGITDAYTKTEVDNLVGKYLSLQGGTIQGDVRLRKGSEYTSPYLYFGDSDEVFLVEETDQSLTIHANKNILLDVGGNVTLNGDAVSTKKWVETQLGDYAEKSSTLAGYGITDAKISNGVITLGCNTITPLTSHQTIYNLTLQAGTFSAATFDPNGGAKTVYIPTTTSHVSEGSNLYFTDERAVNALANTLSSYVDTTLTDQTITKKKTFAEGCWVLAANESGVISNIHMHNSTWGNVSSPTLYGIRNGIGFAWQNTKWVVGNIRGNTADSYGFGIGYHDGSKLSPSFRVTTGGSIYVNGGVYPNSNDASAVGSSAYQWSNIYAKKVTVDGIEMKKLSSGVLFLDANLVVSGGVTMYGTDGTTSTTIWDNAPIATTSAKGIASFDPNFFAVNNGKVTFIGQTGGGIADSVAWDNVTGKPSWITTAKPEYQYTEIKGTPDLAGYVTLSGNQTITGEKIFESSIKIKRGFSILDDQGWGIVGVNPTEWTGLPTDGSAIGFGTGAAPVYIRTSGDDLYHYDKTNDAAYKIIDSNNIVNYKVGDSIKFNGFSMRTDSAFEDKAVDANINYVIDATLLSTSYFYPVIFPCSLKDLYVRMYSTSGTSDVAYNQNKLEFTFRGQGWKDAPNGLTVHFYSCYDAKETTIGCIAMGEEQGYKVVWVRGGLTYYVTSNITPTLYKDGITFTNEKYSYGVNFYGGTNTKVKVYWTPQATSGLGAMYHSGGICLGDNPNVKGINIYKSEKGYLFIDGDLVVKGGITMYGTDGTAAPTIWDGAPKATTFNTTNGKGIASFDSKFFSVSNGHVTFIGDVGGLDESALASYLSTNKYLTQTTGDARYLAISGNAVSASGLSGLTPIISVANESNEISAVRNVYGAITTNAPTSGAAITNALKFRWYDTNWQIGNVRNMSNGTSGFGVTYGSSNLRFLVKTDGVETYGTLKTNGVIPASNGSYSLGSSSYKWTSVYASSFEGNATSATTASKLSTTSKTAWGQTYWTSGGVPTSIDGNMSNVGHITMKGNNSYDIGTSSVGVRYIYANWIGAISGGKFSIGANNGTAITILTDQKIGIGTKNPTTALQVDQSEWSNGITINRTVSGGGGAIAVRSNGTHIGNFGINGSKQLEFNVMSGSTAQVKMTVDSSGNGLFYGGVTMYSDIRKKTILNHVELSLKEVADAPLIEHYYNSDEKKTTHVGSVAQYWAGLNDWFCKEDGEGFLTMEIQNAALASAISVARELTRYESKTDKQIKKLKKRIGELEEEIENLKNK